MEKHKSSPDIVKSICDRFTFIVQEELRLSFHQLSQVLGYKNQSPLTRVKKGEGFISIDKLFIFSSLTNSNQEAPNINWIITGSGPRMIPQQDTIDANKAFSPLQLEALTQLISGKLKI
ncbi:MAG: hypothetical protein HUJ16_10405 [Kangiella sp.]|nr:hypothetical protein [Kangiella sp.]